MHSIIHAYVAHKFPKYDFINRECFSEYVGLFAYVAEPTNLFFCEAAIAPWQP